MLKKYATLIFMIICFFCIFDRGLFELIFNDRVLPYFTQNKTAPYLIQTIAAAVFFIFIAMQSVVSKDKIFIVFFVLFLAISAVSSIITISRFDSYKETIFFTTVMLGLYFFFISMNLLELKNAELTNQVILALFIIGCFLLIGGIIEQLNLYHFNFFYRNYHNDYFDYGLPGHSHIPNKIIFVRPASFTGSMLHYPIIMPIIGVITIRYLKNFFFKFTGILFMLVPLFGFSRSGLLISLVVFFLYGFTLLRNYKKQKKLIVFEKEVRKESVPFYKNKYLILIIFIFVILVSVISFIFYRHIAYYLRIFRGKFFVINELGNSIRFFVWKSIYEIFIKTNLIFGEYTGAFTNMTKNILHSGNTFKMGPMIVPESGFLQILISFGITGALTYYGSLMLSFYRICCIYKEKLLSFVFAGVILQTLFYQSTEVLPFVFLFSLIPFIAKNRNLPV